MKQTDLYTKSTNFAKTFSLDSCSNNVNSHLIGRETITLKERLTTYLAVSPCSFIEMPEKRDRHARCKRDQR